MDTQKSILVIVTLWLLAGCATYTTPGRGVDITSLTDGDIADIMRREPQAKFPANVVVMRAQASDYRSHSNQGYGNGQFSILTIRDIETDADFERLGALPGIAGVGPVNRLVVPSYLQNIKDLRKAAAQLRGDILMLYTVDTEFRVETKSVGPLQVVSLGFWRTKNATVHATCSIALIDVRTGFFYGVAEATASESKKSDVWSEREAVEAARLKAEKASFDQALKETEKLWVSVVSHYNTGA